MCRPPPPTRARSLGTPTFTRRPRQDREVLDRALPGVLEQARVTGGVEVIESDEVTPGGCIVSAGEGAVDARVQTQLDRIAEALVPGGRS